MTYSLADLVRLGGPIMWPLIACSALAAAIIVERFLALGRLQGRATRFLDEVTAAVKRNKVAEALDLCTRTPGPMAAMVRVGLMKYGRPREDIRQAIEDAGRRQVPHLERNLAALATIAHVAPLFGLLGTTVGLIRCFQILQAKTAALQPVGLTDLAEGIWPALLTTAGGLTIAIPALVAYNYFARRIQRLLIEMEAASGEVLNLLAGEGASS